MSLFDGNWIDDDNVYGKGLIVCVCLFVVCVWFFLFFVNLDTSSIYICTFIHLYCPNIYCKLAAIGQNANRSSTHTINIHMHVKTELSVSCRKQLSKACHRINAILSGCFALYIYGSNAKWTKNIRSLIHFYEYISYILAKGRNKKKWMPCMSLKQSALAQ